MQSREAVRLALLRLFRQFYPPPDPAELPSCRDEPAARSNGTGADLNVLVIRPDHLGDLLFATPALAALRRALPLAQITLMAGPWSEPIVRHNPDIDRLLICPFPGFTRQPKGSPAAPYTLLWREARRLRANHYHLALNLRFDFWWGALLAYCAGIPQRYGYDLPEGSPFLSHALPYQPGQHEVLQNLALVHAVLGDTRQTASSRHANWTGETKESHPGDHLPAGPPLDGEWLRPVPELRFVTAVDDEIFAARWLKERNVQPRFCVVLPGAGAAVKLWTADGFAAVADALVERHGLDVVIAGARSEQELVQDVRDRMRRPAVAMVGLAIGRVAAVLRQSRLAIGLDSGIMHLAVALRVPTVHLYGPVDHVMFGPWGKPSRHSVVKSGYWCIPCNRLDYAAMDLPYHPCVRLIDAGQVLAAADQVLRAYPTT